MTWLLVLCIKTAVSMGCSIETIPAPDEKACRMMLEQYQRDRRVTGAYCKSARES
ncbi:MAG: hypothetical protein J0H00_06455 [Burkholderiales bacterium]|nr:hypothetical protein [Burkholderiales bacterium]